MSFIDKGMTGLGIATYLAIFVWCAAQVIVPMLPISIVQLAAQ